MPGATLANYVYIIHSDIAPKTDSILLHMNFLGLLILTRGNPGARSMFQKSNNQQPRYLENFRPPLLAVVHVRCSSQTAHHVALVLPPSSESLTPGRLSNTSATWVLDLPSLKLT